MLPILDDSQRDTAHANGLALLETYRHATERARKNHAQAMKVTPGGATQNRLLERAELFVKDC
jgi:hypothetical protein